MGKSAHCSKTRHHRTADASALAPPLTTTAAAAAATSCHASQWVAPESYKPKKLQKDTRYDYNFMYRKVARALPASSKLPTGDGAAAVLPPLPKQ